MVYERYPRNTRDGRWDGRIDGDDYTNYSYGGHDGRSSAREFAAAGMLNDRNDSRGRGGYGAGYGAYRERDEGGYGDRGWRRDEGRYGRSQERDDRPGYGGGHRYSQYERDQQWRGDRSPAYGRGRDRGPEGYDHDDRDFFSRAGDEIRSWFGDEEAERRREADARYDERHSDSWLRGRGDRDDHYHGWRSRQIAEFDRDYDEYRRENASRFENEFSSWRSERQGQRSSLARVAEHMEVIGSDGQHVGTVDKVRGDRIVLTKSDADASGHHHSIPSRWIETVDDRVTIRKTAEEAKAAWKDEEDKGAMFGDRDDRSTDTRYLNRSFSGTY